MKTSFLNLKTSDKITLGFLFFNFVSLLILLISINLIYFFIWYSDQKNESLHQMSSTYNSYKEDTASISTKYIPSKSLFTV